MLIQWKKKREGESYTLDILLFFNKQGNNLTRLYDYMSFTVFCVVSEMMSIYFYSSKHVVGFTFENIFKHHCSIIYLFVSFSFSPFSDSFCLTEPWKITHHFPRRIYRHKAIYLSFDFCILCSEVSRILLDHRLLLSNSG